MYDLSKRKTFIEPTVAELIAFLKTLPEEAHVYVDGSDMFYAHVDTSENDAIVSFDNSSLDEYYPEPEDIPEEEEE